MFKRRASQKSDHFDNLNCYMCMAGLKLQNHMQKRYTVKLLLTFPLNLWLYLTILVITMTTMRYNFKMYAF